MVDKTVYFATGNRKESTARVRVIPGSGKMTINGVASENYLQYSPNYIRISTSPLTLQLFYIDNMHLMIQEQPDFLG